MLNQITKVQFTKKTPLRKRKKLRKRRQPALCTPQTDSQRNIDTGLSPPGCTDRIPLLLKIYYNFGDNPTDFVDYVNYLRYITPPCSLQFYNVTVVWQYNGLISLVYLHNGLFRSVDNDNCFVTDCRRTTDHFVRLMTQRIVNSINDSTYLFYSVGNTTV